MTTTPKNNVVRLRLTELEREAWGAAAGGKGKLSEWIRATCNAAAFPETRTELPVHAVGDPVVEESIQKHVDAEQTLIDAATPLPAPGMTDLMVTPEAIDEVLAGEVSSTKDAEVETGSRRVPREETTPARTEQCPRWMHHRSGVYCGSCKTVVK